MKFQNYISDEVKQALDELVGDRVEIRKAAKNVPFSFDPSTKVIINYAAAELILLAEMWRQMWPEVSVYLDKLAERQVDKATRFAHQAGIRGMGADEYLSMVSWPMDAPVRLADIRGAGEPMQAVKVKNDPPKKPITLGDWYALHQQHGRPWYEGKIGDWHVHRCGGCGDKTYVSGSQHNLGDKAAIDPPK